MGRKSDLILRAGQNVYPAEIEAYLTTHPKIREAAVVGVPGELGQEEVWLEPVHGGAGAWPPKRGVSRG